MADKKLFTPSWLAVKKAFNPKKPEAGSNMPVIEPQGHYPQLGERTDVSMPPSIDESGKFYMPGMSDEDQIEYIKEYLRKKRTEI